MDVQIRGSIVNTSKSRRILNELVPHVANYIENPYTQESVLVFKNPIRSDIRKDNRDLRGFFIKNTKDVFLWNSVVSHESAWHQLSDLGYNLSNSISFTMDSVWILIYSKKSDDTDVLFNKVKSLLNDNPIVEYN